MQLKDVKTTVIVGTGLLGGSIGLALKKRGLGGEIIGVGRRKATLDTAIKVGAIDRPMTDLKLAAVVADLIILATPVKTLIDQLKILGEIDMTDKVLTDVGSTKQTIVQAAEDINELTQRFVGSHPMAGSAAHGPDAASAKLFEGKMVIVTPTQNTADDALDLVKELWETIGLSVKIMEPKTHDRVVARISHLPHAAAVLLVQMVMEGDSLQAASTGFGDTTRVAGGDPQIWADIFLDNQEQVLGAMGDFQNLTSQMMALIENEDRDALIELLQRVQNARINWQVNARGRLPEEETT